MHRLPVIMCLLLLSLPGCHRDDDSTTTSVYYLSEPEHVSRTFNEATGVLKPGIALKDLSTDQFKFSHIADLQTYAGISSLPSMENLTLVLDGYHALKMSGKHAVSGLNLADAFLNVSGELRAKFLIIGLNIWRPIIFPHKTELGLEAQRASVVASSSIITASLSVWGSSFLEVKRDVPGVLVTNDWATKAHNEQGLVIDAPRRNSDRSDLWRVFNASVDVKSSTIRSPTLELRKNSSLALRSSHLFVDASTVDRGVLFLEGDSKMQGNLVVYPGSYLLFEESSKYTKLQGKSEWTPESARIASLAVDGTAKVDGIISIHVLWSPRDERESLSHYKEFFKRTSEFTLLKANKLMGRATLVSQEKAQHDLAHDRLDINYFERFAASDGKKLALQHNYLRNEITLKLIAAHEALDAQGCLADIGAP